MRKSGATTIEILDSDDLVSVLIILRIRHIGVSEEVLNKMLRNVLVDVFIGSVPILGDIFDFVFKVNERNLKLAKLDIEKNS